MTNITLGADPEFFLTSYGEYISSVGLVGGTKEEPKPLEGLPEGFAIQEDNVAIEGCVPPAKTFAEFNENIDLLVRTFRKVASDLGLELSTACSARFHEGELMTEQAARFGCSEEFCPYLEVVNRIVPVDNRFRTCGGHVHIGYENPSEDYNKKIAIACDITLGLYSLFFDPDTERRQLYGKAGSYRDKSYGVEYRTLSNFWTFSEEGRHFVWHGVMDALDIVMNTDNPLHALVSGEVRDKSLLFAIRDTINRNDPSTALVLMENLREIYKDYKNGNTDSDFGSTWLWKDLQPKQD